MAPEDDGAGFNAPEAQQKGFGLTSMRERAEEIGAALIDDFAAGEVDELVCAYTDFRSAFTLRATSKRFLPIAAAEVGGLATSARRIVTTGGGTFARPCCQASRISPARWR